MREQKLREFTRPAWAHTPQKQGAECGRRGGEGGGGKGVAVQSQIHVTAGFEPLADPATFLGLSFPFDYANFNVFCNY